MLNVFSLVLLCLCLVCVKCYPLGDKYQKQIPSDEALKFMKQYGYIVDDGGQSEALYSEDSVTQIIKTLQKYGGINETGVIDDNTVKLMKSPRCGVPDIIQNTRKKRFATVDGWNKRNITYFVANWSPRLGEITVVKNIQKALDIWGAYGRLTFTRSHDQNADIIVAFGRGYHGDRYPFDGPGLVLAHAFFPYDYEGPDSGGDIHFDDDESWVDLNNGGSVEGTDFFTVALHELGHSLGLGHSTAPTAVMFPYYKGYDPNSNSQLDYDDILGMYNLYITRRIKEDDRTSIYKSNPDLTPTFTTTIPSTTTDFSPPTTTIRYWTRKREHTTLPTRRRFPPWDYPRQTTTTESYWSTEFNQNPTILYEGDVESIDDHKKHDPRHHIPKNNSPSLPYICNGHFDAIATLRSELFIFKDEYLWRLKDLGRIMSGYPIPIRQMFPGLPESVKKIDAAYQRPDGHIVLFIGKQIWIYDGSRFIEKSPLPLSYYGLPDYLDNIDAVQTWAKNGKTYFYKNERFWRYDETVKAMDPEYPLHMERWRGVPNNLDAATTWKGVTYFFKEDLFWKFDNDWIITTETSPLPTAPIWLACREEEAKMKRLFGH